MPRVKMKQMDYKIKDIKIFINQKIAGSEKVIRQRDIAEKIDKSQPRVSMLLNKNSKDIFDVKDLITVFDMVGATKEEIGSLLKL